MPSTRKSTGGIGSGGSGKGSGKTSTTSTTSSRGGRRSSAPPAPDVGSSSSSRPQTRSNSDASSIGNRSKSSLTSATSAVAAATPANKKARTTKTTSNTTPKSSSSSKKQKQKKPSKHHQQQQQLDDVLQKSLPEYIQRFCLSEEVGIVTYQQFLDSRPTQLGNQLQEFLDACRQQGQEITTTTPSKPIPKNLKQAIGNYKQKIKAIVASGDYFIDSSTNNQSPSSDDDDKDFDDVGMEEEQTSDNEEDNNNSNNMENDDEEDDEAEEGEGEVGGGEDGVGNDDDDEEEAEADILNYDIHSRGEFTTNSLTTSDQSHLHRLYDSSSVVPSYSKKQQQQQQQKVTTGRSRSGTTTAFHDEENYRDDDDDDDDHDDDNDNDTATDHKSKSSSSSKGKSKVSKASSSTKASSKVLTVNEGNEDEDEEEEDTEGGSNHRHDIGNSNSALDDDHMDLLSNVGGRTMEIANDDDDDDDDDDEETEEQPANGPSKFDVHVHRVRHLKYMPQAIVSIASNDYGGYIAVARADGSIELNVMGTLRKANNNVYDGDHHHRNKNITTSNLRDDWEPPTLNPNDDKGRYVPHLQPVSKVHGAALINSSQTRRDDDYDRPKQGTEAVTADRMVWVPVGHKGQSRVLVAINHKFSSVWVVDFEHSKNRSNFISGGGSVYDLSVCLDCNNELPLVAGSCTDGKIRIWRVEKSKGKLPKIYENPVFVLPIPGGAPIVSLAWRCIGEPSTSHDGKTKTFNTVFFAAVADGTIRKYNVDIVREKKSDDELNDDDTHYVRYFTQNYESCLRMTVESKGRKNPTIVWDMKLLSDGTLVTCNSLGQVQIWDSREGILLQTIDQADKGNHVHAFTLAVNKAETKIFCSGIDPVVVAIERLHTGMDNEWKKAGKYRPHSHDVRALAVVDALILPPTAAVGTGMTDGDRVLETLVSGGVDTRLCGYDAEAFTSKRPREWRPWPTDSPISTTFGNDQMRLLAFRRLNSIELFQFDKKSNFTSNTSNVVSPMNGSSVRRVKTLRNAECIGEILMKLGDDGTNEVRTTTTQLQASQISPDGKWLVASNAAASFLYCLRSVSDHIGMDEGIYDAGDIKIVPKKVQCRKLPPSTAFHFWNNLLFLVEANRRQVLMIKLTESEDESQSPDAVVCPSKLILPEPTGHRTQMILPIKDIKSSRDGKYVATMTHQDGKQAICIFRGMDRDSTTADVPNYQRYWTIPSLGKNSRPAAMTFVGNTHLAVATFQSHVYVFDLDRKCPSPWSEKNGFPTIRPSRWTDDLLCRYDFPVRLSVDPSDESTLIMSSFETVCLIKLNRRMPKLCLFLPVHHLRGRKKRKFPQLQQSENGNDLPEEDWLLQPYASVRATGEITENNTTVADEQEEQEGKSPIYLRYKGILHVDFFSKKEMVVVEELWGAVNELLPNPLKRSVYGHGV